jgi:pyruvate/2-oxoglutarate dehydrogenase complex dihydrolipoamide dehydrogenase (E3) component
MNGTPEDFDAIIVGAGQAGPPLAARLAGAGQRVAIVERHLIGGTCLNVGCTPTKTMIASAYAAHVARRGSDFGVHVPGPVAVDLAAVQQRARDLVEPRRRAMEQWLSGIEGCEIVRGHARFVGPREIVVGERRLRAHKVFLDVGGRASAPQWPGLGDIPWLSSTDMLSLKEMPRHRPHGLPGRLRRRHTIAHAPRRSGADHPRLPSRAGDHGSDTSADRGRDDRLLGEDQRFHGARRQRAA